LKIQKVSNAFNMELMKNCANQFGIKGRNQKEHSMEEKEKSKRNERERMRKKVEEIHVEDWKSKDCGFN
jgi:hypothetical protein